MQKGLYQNLSSSYLPLLQSVTLGAGRESYRALAKLAHELKNSLQTAANAHSADEGTVWIVHDSLTINIFRSILSAGSFRTEVFVDTQSVKAKLLTASPDIILISTHFSDLIALIHDQHPDIEIVLTGSGDIAASIALLQSRSQLNHMIFDHAFESVFMQRNFLTNCQKIVSGDIFGIEKYLDSGTFIVDSVISGNTSRTQVLDELAKNIAATGLSNVLTRKAHHLTDELLMNSIYDAPIDLKTNTPRYNHLTRAVSVELEPAEYGRFRYGFDGTVLALSIEDPFGALPRDVILKYLKSCFEGEFGKLNETEGKGGGGMGLYQIISSADLFVANILPGERTEVIVLINVHERLPSRMHTFHYFYQNKTALNKKSDHEVKLASVIDGLQKLCERDDPKAVAAIARAAKDLSKDLTGQKSSSLRESVLVISANKRHQRALKSVLGIGAIDLTMEDKLPEIPLATVPMLIAVDDTICDAAPELKRAFPEAKIIALSDRDPQAAWNHLQTHPELAQVMSLDLPKNLLHKLLLTHTSRLLQKELVSLPHYLAFGSTIKAFPKTIERSTFHLQSPDEIEKITSLALALRRFQPSGELSFGFDPHVFGLVLKWKEKLTREAVLARLTPDQSDADMKTIYAQSHAVIISIAKDYNELILLRFHSHEEVPEPFLYTFFDEA
ncbi:MAG: hypothetical protein V4655_00655 [Bdellovibrionota bacterium]|nr:MAG: hypothetical protein EOP10_03255 [Pseudomonadota bacterium]